MKITPVILSGGSGTRLWPISRVQNPKQFLDFFGKNSLFAQTILRVSNFNIFNNPIIICNQDHRFKVAEELEKIKIKATEILLEPIARNTASAITAAAICAINHYHKDDVILVMPSDHIINKKSEFFENIKQAYNAAKNGYLVTFGIKPNKAETGFGYIKKGKNLSFENSFEVEGFYEKPNKKKAEKFIESQNYFWNSGIFIFKASTYLEILKELHEDIYKNCQLAIKNSQKDLNFTRIDLENFEKCQNISIDYAIMEKTKKAAMIPVNIDWSDVGSWQSVSDISKKDNKNNSLIGDVKTLNTKNCYINSKEKLTVTIGVENLIIITLKDVVLIANKENSQDVKKLFEILKKENREECEIGSKAFRPWGNYENITIGTRYKVKKITVNPHSSLSLQMHQKRAEHWVIVKGIANITCAEKEFILNEDQSTYIPTNTKHRLENKQDETLEIIEIQTGNYLEEDDIIRFEDVYGRNT